MKETIEKLVVGLEAKGPGHFKGNDWFQLKEEEEWVLDIDRERWPRMVIALNVFEAVVGTIPAYGADLTDADVQAAQDHFKFGDSDCLANFKRFATEWCGLTKRESDATYAKNEYWEKRCGLAIYPDEPQPVYPPPAREGPEEDEAEALAPCGCLYPGKCFALGKHRTSECFTPQTVEAAWRQAEVDAFNAWWEAEGCRLK
ncbi:MAG TPA: hypothetical protein VGD78_15075, partial [Chthoniobacterales bacterium]